MTESAPFTRLHLPCPDCPSSDALCERADGSTYCFSCKTNTFADGDSRPAMAPSDLLPIDYSRPVERLSRVGIQPDLAKSFGYGYVEFGGEECHAATYHTPAGFPVAQKIRRKDKKSGMPWVGESKGAGLFGQHRWPGKRKRLIVTEGEIDCIAMASAFGDTEAVVSIRNGASGAKKDLQEQLDWLSGFEEIVLCFDEDEPGRKAARECAELLQPGQAKIAHLPYKDAYAVLELDKKDGRSILVRAVQSARVFRPDGLLTGGDIWARLCEPSPPAISYPFDGLNEKLGGGIRAGELVMIAAGTGVGKSQLTKEIADHVLSQGHKLGIMSLEESVQRAILKFLSIRIGRDVALVHEAWRLPEVRQAFESVKDQLIIDDHWGTIESDRLLAKIRFMAKGFGAEVVILDHISIAISGDAGEDERRTIDRMMTNLRSLSQETGVRLIVVSHLTRNSKTPHEEGGRVRLADLRGSGALGHLSDVVLGLERDQQDESVSNETTLRIVKNRPVGLTGVACRLTYDHGTTRMTESPWSRAGTTSPFQEPALAGAPF